MELITIVSFVKFVYVITMRVETYTEKNIWYLLL